MPHRILLVDDIEATRAPLADLLRRRGYQVDEASSGTDGLAKLRASPQTRVIVLDLFMPNGDGWWFREEQLRDDTIAHVPVVVFSVASKTDHVGYALKAHTVLTKPGSIDELFAAIEACCEPGARP